MAAVNSKELNHSGSVQSTSSAFTTPHEFSGTKKIGWKENGSVVLLLWKFFVPS